MTDEIAQKVLLIIQPVIITKSIPWIILRALWKPYFDLGFEWKLLFNVLQHDHILKSWVRDQFWAATIHHV